MAKRIIIPEIKLSGDYLTSAISIKNMRVKHPPLSWTVKQSFILPILYQKQKKKTQQITLHWKVKKTKVKKKPTKTKSYEEENQPRI